jgi:hypothetical protein
LEEINQMMINLRENPLKEINGQSNNRWRLSIFYG